MCLPSTCFLVVSSAREVCYAIRSYGAGGNTIEALLALDGHVGAVGSLELDVKSGCVQIISIPSLVSCLICRRMLTLGGVVEVLVDELCRLSADGLPDG